MAYTMYHQQPQHQRRGNYYDMRGMPYQQVAYTGYFGYQHPMMEVEYQRSRPTKLTPRVLNKRFKKVTIQLNENKVLLLSVGTTGKAAKPCLVFSQCEGSYENKTNSVSIPENLVVPFIQQLHKLSKWRPSTSGSLPTGQSLTGEDTVFRTQVICNSESDVPQESRLFSIKILAETRARDPQDRKELAAVFIPLETSHLMKVKEALNDVIVTAAESPLYHTKSFQGVDGSKFYLDMIRDDECHYLKVSQVTRDFRSILHVPAEDLEAFKELLDASLKAMKGQAEEPKAGGSKKRRQRQGRRRPKRSDGSGNNGKGGSRSGSESDEAKESKKAESEEPAQAQQQPQQGEAEDAERAQQCDKAEQRPESVAAAAGAADAGAADVDDDKAGEAQAGCSDSQQQQQEQ